MIKQMEEDFQRGRTDDSPVSSRERSLSPASRLHGPDCSKFSSRDSSDPNRGKLRTKDARSQCKQVVGCKWKRKNNTCRRDDGDVGGAYFVNKKKSLKKRRRKRRNKTYKNAK